MLARMKDNAWTQNNAMLQHHHSSNGQYKKVEYIEI